MMKGKIFGVQRFSVQDGPGIRSTVFFKGCPLHCIWCHNPESQAFHSEILFHAERCIGCGACFQACPLGLHTMVGGAHIINRDACQHCGKCTEQCYAQALELVGEDVSVDTVIQRSVADRAFFEESDGGVTLSGGEPMAQPAFAFEIAKRLKMDGINVCMETCGFCSRSDLMRIAPYIDNFLFDFKLMDSTLHQKYTGVGNETILRNLNLLDTLGVHIILRCPIIPHINMNRQHLEAIAKVAKQYSHIAKIDLEAYHPLGISKSMQLARPVCYDNHDFLDKRDLAAWVDDLKRMTQLPVTIL